jgi:hypothetical protein
MRWAEHVAQILGNKKLNTILVGKPEGKRPLVRPRCRLGDNFKIDFKEIGCEDVNLMKLPQAIFC